ncbi:MAG: putative Ig domain-containing protein [Verrucomicrobiota bacterium]
MPGPTNPEPLAIPVGHLTVLPTGLPDSAVQGTMPVSKMPTPGLVFEGLSAADAGTFGGGRVAPPDTCGAVGPNHYVQVVNAGNGSLLRIYSKNGAALSAPISLATLFTNGSVCATSGAGDGVVIYDQLADRWVLSQFAFASSSSPPYYQAIAVSRTPDPLGEYYVYCFLMPNSKFNDYPKLSAWSDGYYMTDNQFGSGMPTEEPTDPNSDVGVGVFAFDRAKMLVGDATATYVYFDLATTEPNAGGALPAHVDGADAPPAGAPCYFNWFESPSTMRIFQFHSDFTTPANSTFTEAPGSPVAVASFNPTVNGGNGIPQPGAGAALDDLADRSMFRLQYRNFNTYESLVVNHTVGVGNSAGIRYYQFSRSLPGGGFTVREQATFAPDSNYRWMGSAAMDGSGNLAVGYSVSSSTVFPSIRYAGRLASDPPGGLFQGEATMFAGSFVQTGSLNRWGDYSALTIDPTDNCTFWYTTEYQPANGIFNWATKIGSFRFAECTGVLSPLVVATSTVSGGNGNGSIDPNECNSIDVTITNIFALPIPGPITATLAALTPGVLVVQPTSSFPAVPGNSAVANDPPSFQVVTTPLFPCGSTASFQLTLRIPGQGDVATSFSITSTTCVPGAGPCFPIPEVCVATALDFGTIPVGGVSQPLSLVLTNCGTLPLTITNVAITGANAADFSVVADSCSGSAISTGGTCEVQVQFAATVAGNESAILRFTDNALDSPQSVALSGSGATCGNIQIGPPVLDAPLIGRPYSAQLTQTGANLPAKFFRTAGDYPPGLTLDATGLISGTPTSNGSYTFKVEVVDAIGCLGEKFYTLVVGCPTLTILPGALPLGQIFVAYTQQLTGSGGAAPYTFETVGGSLPAGMTLTSGGLLSGTPTSGSSVFVVRITDANSCFNDRSYTITLAIPPPFIFVGPTNLPNAAVTVPYNANVTATGGTAPHTFSLAGGTLPAGVQLTSAGLLTGNPTKDGVASFTVKATDALGRIGTRAFALDVRAGVTDLGVAINASAPAVQEGDAVVYTVTVTNHGSQPAANCQLSGSLTSANLGTIAAGSSANVQVTVTPTAAGILTQTAQVGCNLADSNAVNDAASVQTTVNARPRALVQFVAAQKMVGAGAGQVTLQLTRTGNVDQPAGAHYYTSDGTARAGVDYVATGGIVNFAAGETTQSVTVSLLPVTGTPESRSFSVRLNAPGLGAQVGMVGQSTCTILPVRSGNTIMVQDADGDQATLSLVGPGNLAVTIGADGAVDEATLTGTQSTSSLAVAIKRGANGDGSVRIGRITAGGSLRILTLGAASLDGTTVTVNGSLGSLRAGTLSNTKIFATGSIGAVKVATLRSSLIAAGFTPINATAPLAGGSFTPGATIKAIKVQSFTGSTVAATAIGKAQFTSVAVNNGGLSFGVLAQGSIDGVGAGSPAFKWNKAGDVDQSVGDFHVRH